jgi:predicted DNA binding protein
MREVILRITMPDNWVKDITTIYPNLIKFKECMPYGESGGRGLIEIENTLGITDDIIKEIKNHTEVCKIDISPLNNGGVLCSIVTNKCVACRALTGSDCFMTSSLSLGDGSVEWKLITGGEDSLINLIDNLEMNGCEVELKRTENLSSNNILTKRQEEIIQAAFQKGYYDCPKKITIKELAEIFDISQSTLGEILQRGERKIISDHFCRKI